MSVTYQNKSEVSVPTEESSITIPVPEGFSAGDLLIACLVKDFYAVIATPAGWTAIQKGTDGASMYFATFYRIAEVGDTEFTFTCVTTAQWYGVILRYTGQASTGFIHASNIATGTSANPTAPDVAYTDLETGSLCLQVFGADDDDTPYTTPVALTERYSGISNTGSYTCGSAGGDKVISGTGNTGTAVFTMFADEQWVAVTVVINAAVEEAIIKTFEDSGVGTDSLLSNKTLILADSGIGTDAWVLPAVVIFSDFGTGVEAVKVDKTLIYSDSGSGVDVILVDKEANFADIGSAIEKFTASYPYPRDLKRKIIIIRDIK